MSNKSNPDYRTMIVPLHGSEYSERALSTATSLTRTTGAQLVLVRAASAPALLGIDASEAQLKVIGEAEGYLTNWAGRLAGIDFRVETAVPFMAAREGILLEINKHHADLVVPSSILLAFCSAAAVGAFFGFYPANQAAQLDPIDALRHE